MVNVSLMPEVHWWKFQNFITIKVHINAWMENSFCIGTGMFSFTRFYIRVYYTTLISKRITSGKAVHIEITVFSF